jgi:hypothetical protein
MAVIKTCQMELFVFCFVPIPSSIPFVVASYIHSSQQRLKSSYHHRFSKFHHQFVKYYTPSQRDSTTLFLNYQFKYSITLPFLNISFEILIIHYYFSTAKTIEIKLIVKYIIIKNKQYNMH